MLSLPYVQTIRASAAVVVGIVDDACPFALREDPPRARNMLTALSREVMSSVYAW